MPQFCGGMKILINYADDKYKKTQQFNSWTEKHIGGFGKIIEYGPQDIVSEYRESYKEIFEVASGNGLWLRKSYFVLRTLNASKDDNNIFYSDSGAFFIRSVDCLIESMLKDIWVSDVSLLERFFTKEKYFEKLDCSKEPYRSTNQIQEIFLLFRNSEAARKFVKEWSHLYKDKERNKDLILHREDQPLLSLLCKKKGILPHRDPSHRGRYPEWYDNGKYPFVVPEHTDAYKSVLSLHKTKNVSVTRYLIDYYKCIRSHTNWGAKLKPVADIQAFWGIDNCLLDRKIELLPERLGVVVC